MHLQAKYQKKDKGAACDEKIQSVTLNRDLSLAMNLLGGLQQHRQRLIPTEERGYKRPQ